MEPISRSRARVRVNKYTGNTTQFEKRDEKIYGAPFYDELSGFFTILNNNLTLYKVNRVEYFLQAYYVFKFIKIFHSFRYNVIKTSVITIAAENIL